MNNKLKSLFLHTIVLSTCSLSLTSMSMDLEIQKFINEYDKSNSIILSEISISASKTPVELSKTGSAVTVLTGEALENSNEPFLVNYLNSISGISIDQNGPYGMLSRISIRGSSAHYAKVLIDGIDITNTSTPQATPYLEKFLLKNIERIEVLRGNQSSLYGSQAIGGVINITSKKPKVDGLQSKFSAEFGSYTTSDMSYTINNRTENNDLSLSVQRFLTEGFSATDKTEEADGYQNLNINFNSRQYLNENFSLNFGGFNINEKGDFDAFGPADNSLYYFKENARGMTLGGNLISSGFNHSLDYSYYNSDRDNYGPNSWDNYKAKGKRNSYSYKVSRNFTKSYNFVGGLDLTEDEALISNNKKSSDLKGVFIENIFDLNNNFTITLGARQDKHSKFGNLTVYRNTLAYRTDSLTYKGSFGTGYRAPSLYELFASTFGNESLKPEKSKHFDLGLTTRIFGPSIKFSSIFFKNSIKDRIAFSGGGYNQVTTLEEREGLEVDIDYKISQKYDSKISYTTITDNKGDYVRKIPKHKFIYSLKSKLSEKLKNTTSYTYVKDLKDTVKLPDYNLIDTRFSYKLNNEYNLSFRIENLLNEQYQLVNNYATPDRSYYFGIDGEF